MSVLIKGMKMPKCCDECDFIQHGGDDWCYITEKEIPCDCPLIELPDHGDLIDRDALKRLRKCEIDEYSDGWTFKDLWEEEEKDMDSLPVIIPAERSEDAPD